MSKTIEFTESKMQIRFRVIGIGPYGDALLYSSESYQSAEDFCWKFPPYKNGPFELRIERVWIPKGVPSELQAALESQAIAKEGVTG